jgi:hypothetical protein
MRVFLFFGGFTHGYVGTFRNIVLSWDYLLKYLIHKQCL